MRPRFFLLEEFLKTFVLSVNKWIRCNRQPIEFCSAEIILGKQLYLNLYYKYLGIWNYANICKEQLLSVNSSLCDAPVLEHVHTWHFHSSSYSSQLSVTSKQSEFDWERQQLSQEVLEHRKLTERMLRLTDHKGWQLSAVSADVWTLWGHQVRIRTLSIEPGPLIQHQCSISQTCCWKKGQAFS